MRHRLQRIAGCTSQARTSQSSDASDRCARSTSMPTRSDQSRNWSSPILPTLKYVAAGCAM